jgi:hypothetical protein
MGCSLVASSCTRECHGPEVGGCIGGCSLCVPCEVTVSNIDSFRREYLDLLVLDLLHDIVGGSAKKSELEETHFDRVEVVTGCCEW